MVSLEQKSFLEVSVLFLSLAQSMLVESGGLCCYLPFRLSNVCRGTQRVCGVFGVVVGMTGFLISEIQAINLSY